MRSPWGCYVPITMETLKIVQFWEALPELMWVESHMRIMERLQAVFPLHLLKGQVVWPELQFIIGAENLLTVRTQGMFTDFTWKQIITVPR